VTNMFRIESLAIGDELLDGRVVDKNTADLGDALSQLGLELQGARTVPDRRALIVGALKDAARRSDILVTSGGLGPTSDDITGECIAEAAGVDMRFDDEAFERIKGMFAFRGIPMPDSNRRQATLPATSRTLINETGTAPGFVTPLVVDGNACEVWSFPGVPNEYRHLLQTYLLPHVRERASTRVLVRRTLRSLGAAESAIGERLGALEKENPDVRVQYRAAFPEIIVRVVVEGDDVTKCEQRANDVAARARKDIGHSVWGEGDEPLEVRILRVLENRKETLVTAESCTGGLVAKRITDVPGSSSVMLGGVVSYANDVKIAMLAVPPAILSTVGAVSEETARAMAEGAQKRMGASWAIATTGVAGPGGGSDDKPVGLVWFALAGPGRATIAVKKKFPDFGRERIREMAAAHALRMILEAATGAAS
jgi:nicotinamide-nucleotide amidase